MLKSGNDSLFLFLSGNGIRAQNHFVAYVRGAKPADQEGPFLKIVRRPELTEYPIRINSVDGFEVSVEFFPGSLRDSVKKFFYPRPYFAIYSD
ncbi:MAG TPA: hypothetical protein VMI35_09720 [Puia sp.]|nr:hypothetical protein [Puia sp.]